MGLLTNYIAYNCDQLRVTWCPRVAYLWPSNVWYLLTLTHWGPNKLANFFGRHFQVHFHERRIMFIYNISLRCPIHNISALVLVNNGPGSGLWPDQCKAITWSIVDQDLWHHMASPANNVLKEDGHALTHWGRDKWMPFGRQHFQVHFLEWKCLNSY